MCIPIHGWQKSTREKSSPLAQVWNRVTAAAAFFYFYFFACDCNITHAIRIKEEGEVCPPTPPSRGGGAVAWLEGK